MKHVNPPAVRGIGSGTVKTETLILVAFICLVLGFLGGVAFGVYKTTSIQLPEGAAPAEADGQLAALRQETLSKPDDPESWARLGHYFFDHDQPEAAIQAYEKSLSIRPQNPDLLTDLGVMYRRNGDPLRALSVFDQALAIDPNHEVALFNSGIVLLHDLQDVGGALQRWQRLLSINPAARTPSGEPLADLVDHVRTHQPAGPPSAAPARD